MKRNSIFKTGFVVMLLLLAGALIPLLAGSISGTITNNEAQPINHSYVQLVRVTQDGGPNGGYVYRNTVSTDNGSYIFNEVPFGQYHVYATAMDYERSFYADPVTGDILVVEVDADGSEVVGVDIQLTPVNDPPPPQNNTIRGHVLNQDNMPVPNVEIGIVTGADPLTLLPNLIGHSNMNGIYEFHNILPGTYKTCALGPEDVILAYSDEFTLEANSIADNIDIHITATPPANQFGSISGHVIGLTETNEMMVHIGLVTLADTLAVLPNLNGHPGFNGEYHIWNIPVGSYKACLLGENNMPIAYSAPVDVIANQNVENVDIIVGTYVGYSISGTIFNAENLPVTSGVVELRTMDSADSTGENHEHMGDHHMHRSVHPDANGNYTFVNVIPGQYIVSVWTMMSPVVFYPGTFDITLATQVVLTDQNLTDINITLPIVQNYMISGIVKDAVTELPIPGILVRTDRMGFHHFPAQDSLFTNEYVGITDAQGLYNLTLPQGRYTLVAVDTTHVYRHQFYDHAANPFEATVLNLNQDITGIDFDLVTHTDSMSYCISGTITENGEAVTYPVRVVAVSSDEDWEESTMSNNTGSYSINHLRPGNYYVAAYSLYAPPTFYNNVLTWDDADIIDVQGAVTGIDFNLINNDTDGTCSLSGSVTSSFAGLSNVMVLLTDSSNQLLGFGRTDDNGQYTVSNVPAGSYTVRAMKLGMATVTSQVLVIASNNLDIVMYVPTSNNDTVVPAFSANLYNYPNPFNPNTSISFSTAKDARLNISIYNIKGQCIRTLWNGNLKSGSHSLSWDGNNDQGKTVPSGIYLVKMQGQGYQQSHKMTLMK